MSDDTDLFSATRLGQLFGLPAANVRNRLENAPVAKTRGNSKLYRMADAAPYLVEPAEDIEAVIKAMRPDDLPVRLHDSFWGGQLKRQKYMEQAGDLWRTEDVERAFGEVFMLFRETVALWAETVERQAGVTDEQRKILVDLSDDLMRQFHEKIEEMINKTPNSWGVEQADEGKEE